ncbi:hypothetical protein GR268_43025, partial [Rhizobium leguminosarum]|nr:hypothetical protein [Rhizobium leguminosarum]
MIKVFRGMNELGRAYVLEAHTYMMQPKLDYAKAARKKKVDGAQLVKVVDTMLSTSPSAGHADHHADGGVVLAALGVKKLGHLKRLQRELRQAMLDSNGGGDDGGENEDGDNNDDDGAEENEEERRKHKA